MTRSRRRKPFFGITGVKSEKRDKRFANRSLRRGVRLGRLPEDADIRDVSNVWMFGKDGKYYTKHVTAKDMRK